MMSQYVFIVNRYFDAYLISLTYYIHRGIKLWFYILTCCQWPLEHHASDRKGRASMLKPGKETTMDSNTWMIFTP